MRVSQRVRKHMIELVKELACDGVIGGRMGL